MYLFWNPLTRAACEAPIDLPCLYCTRCVWSQTHAWEFKSTKWRQWWQWTNRSLFWAKHTGQKLISSRVTGDILYTCFSLWIPVTVFFVIAGKSEWRSFLFFLNKDRKRAFLKSKPRLEKDSLVWINCGDGLFPWWSFCCRGQCASPGWLSSQQVLWSRESDNTSPFHPASTHLLSDYSTVPFPYACITKFIPRYF